MYFKHTAESLKMNASVCELYIGSNKLLASDAIRIGSLLKLNRTIRVLDLRTNNLQDMGFFHIGEGLKEQNGEQGLQTLVLWHNQLTHHYMSEFATSLVRFSFTSSFLENPLRGRHIE